MKAEVLVKLTISNVADENIINDTAVDHKISDKEAFVKVVRDVIEVDGLFGVCDEKYHIVEIRNIS